VALKQDGKREEYDIVVLMPALVSGESGRQLSQVLDVTLDNHGFCEELHGRVDATKSKNRGVYLAGTCPSENSSRTWRGGPVPSPSGLGTTGRAQSPPSSVQ
jgi:heterodisulfide reductase subunit A-like polyferredoxin